VKRKTTLTYEFADETIQEFTLEDLYKLENMSPELAELLIDMDNDIQRNDKKQTRRHISLSTFDDNINPLKPFQAQQSLEEEMIKKELLEAIETEPSLTEKQKRRLIYRIVKGMTFEQIAAVEGVRHQSIQECIAWGMKKIKKHL